MLKIVTLNGCAFALSVLAFPAPQAAFANWLNEGSTNTPSAPPADDSTVMANATAPLRRMLVQL